MVEPRLFERNGEAAGFFFHKSVKSQFQRNNLTEMIVKHGGKVLDEPYGADTVLYNESMSSKTRRELQDSFSLRREGDLRNIVVEPIGFVQDCIRYKKFVHIPPRRSVGGYVKAIRSEFTRKDEDELCWFLSRKVPVKAEGGRLSHNLYKELMALVDIDDNFAWARKHTDQSWREHYKKKYATLDPKIDRYVRTHPPEPPALYWVDRPRMGKRGTRNRNKTYEEDEDGVIHISDDAIKEEESDVELVFSSRKEEEEESSSEEEEEEEELVSQKRKAKTGGFKPTKRRRIESSDVGPSSPYHQSPSPLPSTGKTYVSYSQSQSNGKQPERRNTISSQSQSQPQPQPQPQPRSPIPVRDLEDPGPSQNRQRQPTIDLNDYELQRFSPEPGPTLVERRSSPIPSLSRDIQPPTSISTSSQRRSSQRQTIIPLSSRPSTSFRNVAQSSPKRPGPVSGFTNFQASPRPSGIQSHNTSTTEPSSRSLIVPHELIAATTVVEGNTSGRTEASITRESTHKRTSPVPLPVKRGTSRTTPSSRIGSNPSSVNRNQGSSNSKGKEKGKEKEKEQEKKSENENWAPYRNTRARSRSASVEPVVPQVRKRVGRRGKNHVIRNEEVLEPVVESEHEIRGGRGGGGSGGGRRYPISAMTETLEEENDVAEFLMAESTSGISAGMVREDGEEEEEEEEGSEEDGTEDEGEGERVPIVPKEQEEEEEEEEYDSEKTVSTGNPVSAETSLHDIPNVEILEEEEEDEFVDSNSDSDNESESDDELYSDEVEQSQLESDDAQINKMITASPISSGDSDNETEDGNENENENGNENENENENEDENGNENGNETKNGNGNDYNQMTTTSPIPPSEDSDNENEKNYGYSSSRIVTPQELLVMYPFSPEEKKLALSSRQRKPHNVTRNGSPSPLKPQNRDTSTSISTTLKPQPQPQPSSSSMLKPRPSSSAQEIRRIKEEPGTQTKSQSGPRVSFGTTPISTSKPKIGRKSLPYTPSPFIQKQQTRHFSTESTGSESGFPLSGTRASAMKQELEEKLKVSPYAPPIGSKAAQVIAASQQQQNQQLHQSQQKSRRGKGRG